MVGHGGDVGVGLKWWGWNGGVAWRMVRMAARLEELARGSAASGVGKGQQLYMTHCICLTIVDGIMGIV